jgi:F0F1-type ATP synthase membrane subunit c/vacuolar-type H+-ATPase subunit K
MSLGIDETKAEDVAKDRAVDTGYSALRLIWLAILASVAAIFVVTRLVEPRAGVDKTLFWILFVIGLGNLGASFLLKQKMLKQAVEQRKLELARSAYILAFALCESIGLFGLVAHLITGAQYYYFFFVLSGFGILLHKPQRDDLLAAARGGGIWGARKND